jgi:hypothetical protein
VRGRRVGIFDSSLGPVAPTERTAAVCTIDVLTIGAGLVSRMWVVPDDLSSLGQLDAARRT